MILFEITGTEAHPAYQELEISNGDRQHSFLKSIVDASLAVGRPFLSQHVIKALNFHAITCLHTNPGEYRPCPVHVGRYDPPAHYRVPALMDDFVNQMNRAWDSMDEVALATHVLWRLNYIHPFINGNGRTARASCYFVLCLKAGGLIAGDPILPELLKRERPRYVTALQQADASLRIGPLDLKPLHDLVSELLDEQTQSANKNLAAPPGQNAPVQPAGPAPAGP